MPELRHNQLWYARRGDVVTGPYTSGQVSKYILLGRIRHNDELGIEQAIDEKDKTRLKWKRVSQRPELIPDVMRSNPEDPMASERLKAAFRWADERNYLTDEQKKQMNIPLYEGPERRKPESEAKLQHREFIAVRKKTANKKNYHVGGWLLIIISISAIVAAALQQKPLPATSEIDCSAPAAPGVNWSNCQLQGMILNNKDLANAIIKNANLSSAQLTQLRLINSDLSYTNLSLSDLSGSDMRGALLVGAVLRRANLANTNFAGSDLSYVNFTGANIQNMHLANARLDEAIWVDGRLCLPGSIGRCNTR